MSDDFDDDLDEKPDFRLFFVNKECDECPMHLFDFDDDEWLQTRLRPSRGDHVVKDGTEMVCVASGQYRELGRNEESVWDFSEPEAAKIENLDYARSKAIEDRRSDPHIDPSNSILPLRHF